MAFVPKILAFGGSLRAQSHNAKLVQVAANGARKAGAEVTLISLREYPLPVFDEDVEAAGTPENVRKLKALFLAHHGLLIACPEYNSSITAALKNLIDWVSRPAPGEAPLGCFDGKVAGLMAASPGNLGGLRGLVTVRSILGNIKVLVLPEQVAVSAAQDAFNADGSLKNAQQNGAVEAIGAKVAGMVSKLHA